MMGSRAARPFRLLRHLILLILAALWIVPLYLVLISASTSSEEYGDSGLWQPPGDFALFDNVEAAWNAAKLGEAVISTAFYAVAGALLAVFLAALAALRSCRCGCAGVSSGSW